MIKVLSIPEELRSQIILLHHRHPQYTFELTFIYKNNNKETKESFCSVKCCYEATNSVPFFIQAGLVQQRPVQGPAFPPASKVKHVYELYSEKIINFFIIDNLHF